jgi:hypothetical protein
MAALRAVAAGASEDAAADVGVRACGEAASQSLKLNVRAPKLETTALILASKL